MSATEKPKREDVDGKVVESLRLNLTAPDRDALFKLSNSDLYIDKKMLPGEFAYMYTKVGARGHGTRFFHRNPLVGFKKMPNVSIKTDDLVLNPATHALLMYVATLKRMSLEQFISYLCDQWALGDVHRVDSANEKCDRIISEHKALIRDAHLENSDS